MAVVNNTASEIGDVILAVAVTPIFGIVKLTSFSDSMIGVTLNRFFKKEFSYSIDGLVFSDWQDLTDANLQAITIQNTDSFYVNYKYTRQGSDTSGLLQWDYINLEGEFVQPSCSNYYLLPKSIFKDFFCFNPQHAALCSVLTKKMYEKGIVPAYIERGKSIEDDKDYIDFWDTVCCFFSLIILWARSFENFDRLKLEAFLQQRDVIFCQDSTEMQDLLYLQQFYFDEIKQRGTINIFLPKSESKEVDGEFLRLICYDVFDEFIFCLDKPQSVGWNVGNSSPCYKGTDIYINNNKSWVKTKDFTDLSLLPIFNPSKVTLDTNASREVVKISNVGDSEYGGIGSPTWDQYDNDLVDLSKAIIVDPNMDYEISFEIRQIDNLNTLTFGCDSYNKDNQYIGLKRIDTQNIERFFFKSKALTTDSLYYSVKTIIYGINQPQSSAIIQNTLLDSYNLQFRSYDTCKIMPFILIDGSIEAGSTVYLHNLKIKPLTTGISALPVVNLEASGTPPLDVSKIWFDTVERKIKAYNSQLLVWEVDLNFQQAHSNSLYRFGSSSRGFIQISNWIDIYFKNKNLYLQSNEILNIANRKLLPYNSHLNLIDLNE